MCRVIKDASRESMEDVVIESKTQLVFTFDVTAALKIGDQLIKDPPDLSS